MRYQRFFIRTWPVWFLLAVILISCNKPECNNTNVIFERYTPGSQQYNAELVKQLQAVDQSKLSYRFLKYAESNEQEMLYFNVQGEGLCAQMVLNVDNWNKLELLRQKKGMSFRGARFENLVYEVKQDSGTFRFVYQDVGRIID